MKICIKCEIEKPVTEYYIRSGKPRNECKVCFNKAAGLRVTKWRQAAKEKLVIHFGSKCIDCKYTGPPFMFDFDHRVPEYKAFGIGGKCKSYASLLIEAEKCDLVCANCHRMRTHKQRCNGCEYC